MVKKRKIYPYITIIMVFLLMGCAKCPPTMFGLLPGCADGPKFSTLDNYKGQDTIVYIYRPQLAKGAGIAPDIVINGKSVVLLKNGGFAKISLKSGPYTLETRSNRYYEKRGESTYYFTIPSNIQRTFIRFASKPLTTSDVVAFSLNLMFSLALRTAVMPFDQDYGLTLNFMNENDALKEIEECNYLEPEVDSIEKSSLNVKAVLSDLE